MTLAKFMRPRKLNPDPTMIEDDLVQANYTFDEPATIWNARSGLGFIHPHSEKGSAYKFGAAQSRLLSKVGDRDDLEG